MPIGTLCAPAAGFESFASQTICEVITKLDSFTTEALTLKDQAITAIEDINAAYEAMINTLPAAYVDGTSPIGVYTAPSVPTEPDFSTDEPAVPVEPDYSTEKPSSATRPDYSALGPTAVTLPNATDVVIGDTEWERINALAAADLALIGVGEELAAASEANWRNTAVPSVVSALWASESAQRTMDRVSAGRLVSSVEQAKAAREDIKDVTQLALNDYTAQANWTSAYLGAETQAFNALIAEFQAETGWVQVYHSAEAAKLQARIQLYAAQVQWLQAYTQATANLVAARVDLYKGELQGEEIKARIDEIEVKRLLEIADKTSAYALERAKIVEDRGVQVAERTAVLMAGIAQAFLSASSYSLSGSGGHSTSTN